jgi:hypothetical protein
LERAEELLEVLWLVLVVVARLLLEDRKWAELGAEPRGGATTICCCW